MNFFWIGEANKGTFLIPNAIWQFLQILNVPALISRFEPELTRLQGLEKARKRAPTKRETAQSKGSTGLQPEIFWSCIVL